MPKDLFREDREVEQETLRAARDKRAVLAGIEAELELFRHPAWRLFQTRLEELVENDRQFLESCPVEDVPATRAKIKAHRHLLGLEARLQGMGAELREALASPEEDHD